MILSVRTEEAEVDNCVWLLLVSIMAMMLYITMKICWPSASILCSCPPHYCLLHCRCVSRLTMQVILWCCWSLRSLWFDAVFTTASGFNIVPQHIRPSCMSCFIDCRSVLVILWLRPMAHDPSSLPKFWWPDSGTSNLGGELGSCAMGLNQTLVPVTLLVCHAFWYQIFLVPES